MIVETVRLTKRAREQLIRLKSRTGIQQWNILSRWALCLSLADPTPPSAVAVSGEAAVEMSWKVFGGEGADVYEALLRLRCVDEGAGTNPRVVSEQFRLHLHRGIGMLTGLRSIESVGDLLDLAPRRNETEAAQKEKQQQRRLPVVSEGK